MYESKQIAAGIPFGEEFEIKLQDLSELNLSNKAMNCLSRRRVDSIEKLLKLSEDKLLSTRGTGVGTIREIRSKLGAYSIAHHDLDALSLSVRAMNCLREAGITTMEALLALRPEELIYALWERRRLTIFKQSLPSIRFFHQSYRSRMMVMV